MRTIKQFGILSFVFGIVAFNQACSQMGIGGLGISDTEGISDQSSLELNVTSNPYALLSAEQVLKGFSSVTGVPVTANGVMNEFNARRTIMAGGFDLNLVTSPMMIAIANLGSQFCLNLVNTERGIASSEDRKFFRSINFSAVPTAVSDGEVADAVQNMAVHFWGRVPTSEEVDMILEGKSEFVGALTDAQRTSTASTTNMMLFTCTAMLASFDSITL